MFFGYFFKQVGHSNLARATSQQQGNFYGCSDVIGVNMAVVQTLTTYNNNGVADLAPRQFEISAFGIIEVKKKHDFISQLTHINLSS